MAEGWGEGSRIGSGSSSSSISSSDAVGCSGNSDGDSDVGLSVCRLAKLQLFYLYIEFFILDRCWYIYIVQLKSYKL